MRVLKKEKGYPILFAFETNTKGHLSAWCPYCAKFHNHGAGEGHRIAHCTEEHSPFKQTGYILKKGSLKDYEELESMLLIQKSNRERDKQTK